ncbi:MAG: DUF692 domain-containing protein [Parachlamydiaceae bacterium]|nr:DUF692 domain-containing protein [Parachlamydiaceae bacterium]
MINGIGIGLRPEIIEALLVNELPLPAFVELSPEHWIGVGGYNRHMLDKVVSRYPIMGHGLSLSLGSPDPLDWDFLKKVKAFMVETSMVLFSEHLSFSKCGNAHLNGLFPLPFRYDAAKQMIERIKQVQDYIGRQIAIENISYYTTLAPEMNESEFLSLIAEEADCLLLLDVSNVFVNGSNHGYDPKTFISQLPLNRIGYIHLAGNYVDEDGHIIDSHDRPVNESVRELLDWTVPQIAPVPVLVERDLNFPEDYRKIYKELEELQAILDKHWKPFYAK